MQLKFQFLGYTSYVRLLSSLMWLMASIVDSVDIEYFHHYKPTYFIAMRVA